MREFQQSHKSILLADDDADDRELFVEAVNFIDPNITVTLKSDGEELMDFLAANTVGFDLIFLDLNMPRKNGKECLSELTKSQQAPVIIYTTSLNPIDIEETFALGAACFLRKPNSFEELKATLAIVLKDESMKSEKSKERFVIKRPLNFVR
jgi:CheY-like chemotaxis protein